MENKINWTQARLNLAGLAMQGILEREQGWLSKLASDALYKDMAKHCVKLADAIIEEVWKNKNERT
jgi:hypothetical protein